MNKLTKYIAQTVLSMTFIILVVFIGLFLIISFIEESGNLGQGSYNAIQAFIYVCMMMPSNMYLFLPMAGLLGSLMGLGLLSSHNEIVIMRSIGFSAWQIAKGVSVAASIIMLLCFFLGSYLAPQLQHKADIRKSAAMSNQAVLISSKSVWLKDGDDFIFVGGAKPDARLDNVTRYRMKDHHLKKIITARSAQFDGESWLLKGVTTTDFKTKLVDVTYQNIATWKNPLTPYLLKMVEADPDNLNLVNLKSFIDYRKDNDQNATTYEVAFWQTIFQPISVLVLMLLAIPFVFGPLRSTAAGYRLILGVIIGFSFFMLNEFFGPLSILYELPPIIGAAAPSVIFLSILLGLFYWRA